LAEYADHVTDAAAVGAKLLFPSGQIQHAGVVICQDRYPRHIYAGFPSDHPAVNKSRRFQAVTAACALVRRSVFEQLGGFDTSFVNGYEDIDLFLRLGESGQQVHYCPESVVTHFESITRGDTPSNLDQNDRLYRERWADRVRPDDLQYYVDDGLLSFRFDPGAGYPARLWASPLLATHENGGDDELQRLLGLRSRQVFDLIKETIRLRSQLEELDLP
jgi:GT2 family glycosyltransferase